MQLFKNAALELPLLSGSLVSARAAETPLPDAIAAPGETVARCTPKAHRSTNARPAPTASRPGHSARRLRPCVTTVQRINTIGGKLESTCDNAGTYKSAPYSADYVFLRKG